MDIEIKSTMNFPYQFIITPESDLLTIIRDWCAENCRSMWIISSHVSLYSYAPIAHKNPLGSENFGPAHQTTECLLLMFEADEDATAFKLRWA